MALLAAFHCTAAVTATQLLDKVRAKFSASPSVEAVFTIAGEHPLQGNALMAGNAFTLNTPQIEVWFDGKTQWTLIKSSQEVSVTEPDAEEMMAANPFAILTSPGSFYTARRLSDSRGRARVELTPRDKTSGIEKIIVHIDTATSWPSAVVVDFADDRRIELMIDKITPSTKKSAGAFRYDASRYPAAEIIDLR